MARKNLLAGLMGSSSDAANAAPAAPPAPTPSLDPERPRYAKGAVGAISRSVAELQARALSDIDPHLIDACGVEDRVGPYDADDVALRESIAEYGQHVPVLVRPHPSKEGRYQIVYGRRRVAALKELGRPVKALVRQLDNRELIVAQGQENSARRDLSFIEKANFAQQLELGGYDRKTIGDALSTDKTLISRFLSVADRVPFEVVNAIGAAPSVGRERWLALADALEARPQEVDELVAKIEEVQAKSSDERFEAALRIARGPRIRPERPVGRVIHRTNGETLAEVERKGGRLTLRFHKSIDPAFDDWLLEQLPTLHDRWTEQE